MTEWRRLDDGSKESYAQIEPSRTYRLSVGQTAAYGPHVLHNTHHPQGAWVVRVTGCDLDTIPRQITRQGASSPLQLAGVPPRP